METNNKNGQSAQGAESPKPITESEVKEFVKRDIATAINLLDAIYKDQDTINMLSAYLYGRFMNAKHKEELAKQTTIQ